jgi:hypothetical protein
MDSTLVSRYKKLDVIGRPAKPPSNDPKLTYLLSVKELTTTTAPHPLFPGQLVRLLVKEVLYIRLGLRWSE